MEYPKRNFKGLIGLLPFRRSKIYKMIREPGWYLTHPRARESRKIIEQFSDKHIGETCYIIGGGPSLLKTDLACLNGKLSIGLNRLYLGFQEFQFQPTYMVCVNELLMQQWGSDFSELKQPFFTGWSSKKFAPNNSIFLRTMAGTDFSDNISDEVFVGSTVTFVALQLAFWMGCSRVVLLGIDHNYIYQDHEAELSSHSVVVRQHDDQSHFSKDYFNSGSKWQIPDLDESKIAYEKAKERYVRDGRIIVDGTIGGKLQVFDKVMPSEWN